MKRNFEKIKLNQFSKAELEQRKLNALKGGCGCNGWCPCACQVIGGNTGPYSDYDFASMKNPDSLDWVNY